MRPAHADWGKGSCEWLNDADYTYTMSASAGSSYSASTASPLITEIYSAASGSIPGGSSYTSANVNQSGNFEQFFIWTGTGTPTGLTATVGGYVVAQGVGMGTSARASDPNGGSIGSYAAGGGGTVNFPNPGSYSIFVDPSSPNQTSVVFNIKTSVSVYISGSAPSYSSSGKAVVNYSVP